jgi:hypothetical protein
MTPSVASTNIFSFVLQPLLHTIVFLVEMAVAIRLAAKFNSYYAEKPGKMLYAKNHNPIRQTDEYWPF